MYLFLRHTVVTAVYIQCCLFHAHTAAIFSGFSCIVHKDVGRVRWHCGCWAPSASMQTPLLTLYSSCTEYHSNRLLATGLALLGSGDVSRVGGRSVVLLRGWRPSWRERHPHSLSTVTRGLELPLGLLCSPCVPLPCGGGHPDLSLGSRSVFTCPGCLEWSSSLPTSFTLLG